MAVCDNSTKIRNFIIFRSEPRRQSIQISHSAFASRLFTANFKRLRTHLVILKVNSIVSLRFGVASSNNGAGTFIVVAQKKMETPAASFQHSKYENIRIMHAHYLKVWRKGVTFSRFDRTKRNKAQTNDDASTHYTWPKGTLTRIISAAVWRLESSQHQEFYIV